MSQMKEEKKITERELNKMEISTILHRDFKDMVIEILTGFE